MLKKTEIYLTYQKIPIGGRQEAQTQVDSLHTSYGGKLSDLLAQNIGELN
jgi:hypothetical protein